MSSNAIEKALWHAVSNPADGQRFREDAQSYLKDFRLDDEERALISSWNVSALASRKVNELLLMMAFTAFNGIDKMPDYIQRIHQPG